MAEYEEEPDRYGFIVDQEGRILSASESAPRVLGYSREELIMMRMEDLSPYSARLYGEKEFTISKNERRALALESTHRTKSGLSVPIRVHIQRHASSGSPQTLELCDVLPLPPVRMVQDAPPRTGFTKHACVLEVDQRGRIVYMNKACEVFLGGVAGSLLGASLFDLLCREDEDRYRRWFMEMAQERAAYSLSDMYVKNANDSNVLRIHHAPAYRDDGSLRGYTLTLEREAP